MRSPGSESALVTGLIHNWHVYLTIADLQPPAYQELPTNPIEDDLDVGWRLALASKTIGVTGYFIMGRFILVYT